VNLITVHDGFTLADLVSYNDKHNQANGEDNRDGTSDNRSWNCGAEGPTDDPDILALRARQSRAMLTTLMLSFGVPLLLGGDEMGRTQQGNNNAYCQDNQITWFDWTLLEKHRDLHRFVKTLIRQRRVIAGEPGVQDLTLNELLRNAAIEAHGVRLHAPDFGRRSHSLAMTVRGIGRPLSFHAMFNAYWEPLAFELPPLPAGSGGWRRWIDTHEAAPRDVYADGGPVVPGPRCPVGPRSIVVLLAQRDDATPAAVRQRPRCDDPGETDEA
jgi:glycogen operon protein